MSELRTKYHTLPRSWKVELKQLFREEFGIKTDSTFKHIMLGNQTATPLQNQWLSQKVEEYYNLNRGVVQA